MKVFSLILALFVPFALAKSEAPPDTINIIRPDPNANIPRGSIVTIGYAEPSNVIYGLIQNVTAWYKQPDGTAVPSFTYGSQYTEANGNLKISGYNPAQCRTYPGVMETAPVTVSQSGIYTFFWNVTYIMSTDPTQANSSYCGPVPFSTQSWLVNSTVNVLDAYLGAEASVSATPTSTKLPSEPTGHVSSEISMNRVGWIFAVGVGAAAGLIL